MSNDQAEEKEELEKVVPGKVLKGKKKAAVKDPHYVEMKSNEHAVNCRCGECRKLNRPKRDESVIGRVPGKEDSESERDSLGSESERERQRAVKEEDDPPNGLVFRCPNCDSPLRMKVTKRKKWDDSNSLQDAKDDWSGRDSE